MILNASIFITLSRIFLAVLMIAAVFFNMSIQVIFLIFLVASMTDWLDGFVARQFNQVTELGAYLDPVADKALFCCGLIVFFIITKDRFIALLGGLMVLREVLVSWLRWHMSSRNQQEGLPVSYSAKLKTTFQLLAIGYGLLSLQSESIFPFIICYLLIVLAFIFSIISMVGYIKNSYQLLTMSGKTP